MKNKMQGVSNDIVSLNNIKCVEVNDVNKIVTIKEFINGIHGAQKTLRLLERSLHKTNKYEQKRVQCKNSHRHSHDSHEWWDSDPSFHKSSKYSNTYNSLYSNISSQTGVGETNTLSTMSVDCLRYKYEELSKRYEALLQVYEDQCRELNLRDIRLSQWREQVNLTQTQLVHVHKSLLAIGEKYLALRRKKNALKNLCKERVKYMENILHDVVEVSSRELMRFDTKMSYYMSFERNSNTALLLYEIRKCNLLFLENMRLKTVIEKLLSGHVVWN